MELILKSLPNPDHNESISPAPGFRIQVPSLENASKSCMEYIAKFNLGAGNWAGGDVYDGQRLVANISYNGRIWKVD